MCAPACVRVACNRILMQPLFVQSSAAVLLPERGCKMNEASGESPTSAPHASDANTAWPSLGSLAALLEQNKQIRERLREKGHFTRWVSLKATGIPSVKNMTVNTQALEVAARWWCSWQEEPSYIPIDLCRREACRMH